MTQRLLNILNHLKYKNYYTQIIECEKARLFCKHDMSHFLDVARIAYILVLEDNMTISKELIYATALLHDIGRHEEYKSAIPHERASASLCVPILKDCLFNDDEITLIQTAILDHRNTSISLDKTLSGYIYRGDKASRPCHSCLVEKECHWPADKKRLLFLI